MGVTYSYAGEAGDLAKPLISKHHDRLGNVRIEYVFISEARKKQGEPVAGSASIVSGRTAFLVEGEAAEGEPVEAFFVIELAEDLWGLMMKPQKIALLDHQLSHCDFDTNDNDGSRRLFLAQHDVEDFTSVVRRHGLWQRGLKKFAQAVIQLELPIDQLDQEIKDEEAAKDPEPGEAEGEGDPEAATG